MINDNELLKDDFILPGGLGEIGGREIIKTVSDYRKGTLTITVAPPEGSRMRIIDDSNCVFDAKKIRARLEELCPTEDADFEILPQNKIEL